MEPWSRELRSLTVLKMTVRVTWNINLVLVVCRKGETKSSYFVVKPDEIWCGAGRSMIELHACALSFSFHFFVSSFRQKCNIGNVYERKNVLNFANIRMKIDFIVPNVVSVIARFCYRHFLFSARYLQIGSAIDLLSIKTSSIRTAGWQPRKVFLKKSITMWRE